MTGTPTVTRPTPFHVRTAERNRDNVWRARNGFTLPAHYGDARAEALAVRFSAIAADVSHRAWLRFTGARAGPLCARAFGQAVAAIEPGASRTVLWRADGGGVRGTGTLARLATGDFVLLSYVCDHAWFEDAAARFGVRLFEETGEAGLLALAGPFAAAILEVGGLAEAATLEPGRHRAFVWRGLDVTVSRWGVLGGYEIGCAADDAVIVFDRVMSAGAGMGLALAGEDAFATILMETGVAVPCADWAPARDPFATGPAPETLGLAELAGTAHATPPLVLAGIVLDSEEPAPRAAILKGSEIVGATLGSLYSPALKRAIALAQIAPAHAGAGTAIAARHAGDGAMTIEGTVVDLPFLPIPDQIRP